MTAPTGTYEGPWHTGMRRKNSTWMSEATPAPRKVDWIRAVEAVGASASAVAMMKGGM